jgi:hypothetical protein
LLDKNHDSYPMSWTMRETTVTTIVPRWRPLLVLGILAAIAGVIAVLAPQFSTLAVNLIIGALLLFDGVLQGIHAWSLRGGGNFACPQRAGFNRCRCTKLGAGAATGSNELP